MSAVIFKKDIISHPLHYFSLLCLLGVGLWGIFWFDYSRVIQLRIVISLGVAYVMWGMVHHWYHRDLHLKVVWEYLLVAVLAVVIFTSLVLGF